MGFFFFFFARLRLRVACGLQREGMWAMTNPWEAQNDNKQNGGHGAVVS